MPTHIPIEDKSNGAKKVDVRTQGEKARDTLLASDPNHYQKAGSKGGKNSPVRPFKDPAKARAAVNARWAKRNGSKKTD